MQVTLHNNVRVYNLTAGKTLPEWLAAKRSRRTKGGSDFTAADERRVELLHDFEFHDSAQAIFRTSNGSFIFAAGDYPPRLKCYDVNEMSVKFSFNADMRILSGLSLSPDFRKFALRGEGRAITIHNAGNIVERLRVPHTQRCLAFHPNTAELLSGGTSHEVHRINLERGCFVESFKTRSDAGVNSIQLFEDHGLILCACDNGTVEAFDARQAQPAGVLQVAGVGDVEPDSSMRSIACDRNGLLAAVGSDRGQVALFDIRLSKALLVKDHLSGLPIVKVALHSSRAGEDTHVISADTNCVRIWHKHDGKNFTSIDTPAPIHDFVVFRAQHNLVSPYQCTDSGVIAVCCDTPKVQVHFVPQLGPAPRWAGFLDAITEEMEEDAQATAAVVYDDFKFILKDEAESLGLTTTEIADGRVRPAMHGVYIETRLYRELKAAVDPRGFERMVEDNRRRKRQTKLEERISQFHRHDAPLPMNNGGPLPSGVTTATARGAKGAAADPVAAMMRGLTPQAIDLLTRDPRFAAKMGLDAFSINKDHPEYTKLFQKVQQERERVAKRRAEYDMGYFRVVADDTVGDALSGPSEHRDQPMGDEAHVLLKGRQRKVDGNDGVEMMEATHGASVVGAATDAEAHAARKTMRLKRLTLAEQLKKTQPRPKN